MLHQKNAVRLVLPSNMLLIWHERLYHGGAKSRLLPDPIHPRPNRKSYHVDTREADMSPSRRHEPRRPYVGMEDMRIFRMIYNDMGKEQHTRGDTNVSIGDTLYYRDQMFCPYYFEEDRRRIQCPHCARGNIELNLTTLGFHKYRDGDKVLGDLTTMGWEVFRSRHIHPEVESAIRNICGRGDWHTIDRNRLMKYQTSTPRPPKWNQSPIKPAFDAITDSILKKRLPTKDYQFGYINVLKNSGLIYEDQRPHYDYDPP